MLQLSASPFPALSAPPATALIPGDFFFWLIILAVAALIIVGFFYLLRAILHGAHRQSKAFNRVVLQILVPKERKTEGQGNQLTEEDRLERVKEEIGITETFFAAIAGLKAQRGLINWLRGRTDHFACEIVVRDGLIRFYIDVSRRWQQMIEQQIHAQYPYAEVEEMTDYNLFHESSKIVSAYLIAKQLGVFPFKTYKGLESDPLSASLNVLARIRDGNSAAAIQYVIRSAQRRWRRPGVDLVREVKKGKKFEKVIHSSKLVKAINWLSDGIGEIVRPATEKKDQNYQLSPLEEEMIKGVEQKLSKGGLDVNIRLLSVSDNAEMARQNLDNLVNAYSQYNLYRYGNSFQAVIPHHQSLIIRDFIFRSFHERRQMLLNTEEMAGLWHLPLHSTEAPNIEWLGARKAPPPANAPKSGLLLGHVQYRGVDTPIYMKEDDRRRHLYVIGKSGSGKSVLLSNLAIQDIQNGHGVCVVDPHGDLVEDVLAHVPKERAEDVILFNPSDVERPIGLNMLEVKTEDQKDFAVQEMIAIFYKLFPPEMIGPMFEHHMRNVMLTLMGDINDPGTIIDIPRMFSDDEYAKTYVAKLKDPVVRAYWEKEVAKTSDFHKSEMLGYLISKVGRFVENEMMRNIMGQQTSGFNFREVMDKQKILLVNLSKGTTGEVNAKLLGLIIVAKLQMAALSRAELPMEERADFFLYIDEFQNFITDSISTILSEARKYRLDLIVAHQYMGQLTDEKGRTDIRDAVLGNAGTMSVFRIGTEDTEVLAKEFAPTFSAYDLLNVPKFSCYIRLLIDNTVSKPFNLLTYPPRPGNKALAAALKELSRLKYGRDRRIVEAEILERTRLGVAESKGKTDMVEASL